MGGIRSKKSPIQIKQDFKKKSQTENKNGGLKHSHNTNAE